MVPERAGAEGPGGPGELLQKSPRSEQGDRTAEAGGGAH